MRPLAFLLLAACAAPPGEAPPDLLPLTDLLAAADGAPAAPEGPGSDRLAALAARAAALRGPVLDAAERARLGAGPAPVPAPAPALP